MRVNPLTRRAFLGLAGGALLAAACGDDGNPNATDATTVDEIGLRGLRVSSDLYASATPQRLAFALTDDNEYLAGPATRVSLAPADGPALPTVPATLEAEGLPAGRGVYVVEPTLATPGIWSARLEVEGFGEPTELPIEVGDSPVAPPPGIAAPRAASPTTADPLGTDPLCTRQPPCDLHEASLEALVGAGRPVAVLFATPARCQTQYCGPVLDQLLPLQAEYAARIALVHVEIYRSNRGTALVPTVEAWNLPSEPWLFGLDGAGTIVARLDGAFSTMEIRTVLDALVST